MKYGWALLALLLSVSGCAIFDPPEYPSYEGYGSMPPSTCYRPPCADNTAQSPEPELLRK
jgi:hypothetical protein